MEQTTAKLTVFFDPPFWAGLYEREQRNKKKANRARKFFIWKGVFMNTKENILDAWIVVENLSEGSVEPGEQGMMTPDRETENWEEHFREFLQQNKEKEKLSDKAFQKSGIVLFLGIFDFDEVIDILKKKYNLEDTYEDRSKSKKFTAALFFDKDLQFLGNKFFYTMSGYIRNYGDFPKDIGEEERNLSDEIRGKFERERNKENGFHCVITVSYTHLDVYKRQHEELIEQEGAYKKLFCSQKELEAYSMKKRKAVAE